MTTATCIIFTAEQRDIAVSCNANDPLYPVWIEPRLIDAANPPGA